MKSLFTRLFREEEGQNLVEYALIGALVSIAAIAAMNGLAGAIGGTFGTIEAALP